MEVSPLDTSRAVARIAVVIPCYKVVDGVCEVIALIGPEVSQIYCVDDKCPDQSGRHIEAHCRDPRVVVIYNERNLGVGGATLAGFRRAAEDDAEVVVKIDGDGQMDPGLLERFVRPIRAGRADYTKGNRFYHPMSVRGMPLYRLAGNAVLSFLTKLSSGYWHLFDPTNGYVAIHREALANLRIEDISAGYFFESDMLFHLNVIGAVIEEVPMNAVYRNERSSLVVRTIIFDFLIKNLRNLCRRLVYNYFLRNFTFASIEILLGSGLLLFGVGFGVTQWLGTARSGMPVTAGTVMLAALPVILGVQLLLSFLSSDMQQTFRVPLHKRLGASTPLAGRPNDREGGRNEAGSALSTRSTIPAVRDDADREHADFADKVP